MSTHTQPWTVGTELPAWTAPPVTRTEIVIYQGAAGDFDAAHHDDEHARRFGYPGVFSLGMLHAGILSAYLVRHFPPASVRRFRTRFVAVVYPGDVLTYRGSVSEVREVSGLRLIEVALRCTRGDTAIIEGTATLAG